MLIPAHPVRDRERLHSPLQGLISRQGSDAGRDRRRESNPAPRPHAAVADAQMTPISAKQFVRSLSDQGDFYVFAGSLAHEIHRHNRGCCDRLFQARTIFGSASSKVDLVIVTDVCFDPRIRAVSAASANSSSAKLDPYPTVYVGHALPVQIHQSKQQPGIDAAAQQQANRNIADELPLHRALVKRQQLLLGFARGLWRLKRTSA